MEYAADITRIKNRLSKIVPDVKIIVLANNNLVDFFHKLKIFIKIRSK